MNEEPTFKIVDRRQFNLDGTSREAKVESGVEAKIDSKDNEKAESGTLFDTPPQSPQAAAEQPIVGSDNSEKKAEDNQPPALDFDDPASFVNFLMSIASNAAASLGMVEHPVTGQKGTDLPLAKHWIDVISMLHEKTSGNLHPEEQQMLDGLLADMRMQYVSLINTATRPGKNAWTGAEIIGGK